MAQLIIDVSEHNGLIDWQQVKDAGYHAIIRCGFGRFDSGGRYDNYWERNISECERLGIPHGVYWYSYAAREESARIEAQQCLDALAGRTLQYPVFFDAEEGDLQAVSYANAVAFCSAIEGGGFRPGIYSYDSWVLNNFGDLVDRYPTWVASVDRKPYARTDMWQYTFDAKVPGTTEDGIRKCDVSELWNESLLVLDDTPEPLPGPSVGDPSWNIIGIEGHVAEVALGEAVVVHPQIDTDTTGFTYNFTWNLLNGDWTNGNWGSTVLYTGTRTDNAWYSFTPDKVGEYGIAIDCYDTKGGYRQASFGFKCVEKTEETPEPEPEQPAKKRLTYNQAFAEAFYHMCTHDGNGGHGYSQYRRWGDGTQETVTLTDGTQINLPNGDFDCSSGIITACEAVKPGCTGGATYTGDMKSGFLSTGLWQWHPMGDGYIAQPGDIYLNQVHHTAMCWTAEPDVLMQFSISENGTVSGQQGDQTGYESNIKAYYNYPWDGKLVYVGPQPAGSGSMEPGVPSGEPSEGGDPSQFGLTEDGYWGAETTKALQTYYGTVVDGEVWHQWPANAQDACTGGWQYDYTQQGSPVIRALQRDLGVTTDGILGADTIRALQTRMGTYVDGKLDAGSSCVAEMQRRLNAGSL